MEKPSNLPHTKNLHYSTIRYLSVCSRWCSNCKSDQSRSDRILSRDVMQMENRSFNNNNHHGAVEIEIEQAFFSIITRKWAENARECVCKCWNELKIYIKKRMVIVNYSLRIGKKWMEEKILNMMDNIIWDPKYVV